MLTNDKLDVILGKKKQKKTADLCYLPATRSTAEFADAELSDFFIKRKGVESKLYSFQSAVIANKYRPAWFKYPGEKQPYMPQCVWFCLLLSVKIKQQIREHIHFLFNSISIARRL